MNEHLGMISHNGITAACPSDEMLRDFCAGKLSTEAIDQLACHLERCLACAGRLDAVPIDSQSVLPLRLDALPAIEFVDDEGWQKLNSLAKAIDPSTASIAASLSETTVSIGGAGFNAPHQTSSKIPRQIGRYLPVRRLGRGGFADVFLAEDPDLKRLVAIKTLRTDKSRDKATLQQFLDEARIAAVLNHAAIVPVYDVVSVGDGSAYVVMEYMEQGSLEERMQQAPLTAHQSVELLIPVAEALHYIHQRKDSRAQELVHRDVKPANILLDGHGDPHLTDFGLSLSAADESGHRDELAGTYPFMSPEQVRRKSHHLDGRADIWAVGVTLYIMLTKRRPFKGESAGQLFEEILHRDPKPPTQIDDSIDRQLEAICLKCLEKRPLDRYSSAGELAETLRHWLGTPTRRTQRGLRTRLILAAVATCISVPTMYFAIAAWIGPKQELSASAEVATTTEWRSLLDREPLIISWRTGDGRRPPQHDRSSQSYAVRSDRTQWVAKTADIEATPFSLRAVVEIEGWIGHAGFFWALRDDPAAFPEKRKHFLAIEYSRVDTSVPPELILSEGVMTPSSFDDWRITSTRDIAKKEITIPTSPKAPLHVSVKEGGIVVRFDGNDEWSPLDPRKKTNWLPRGKTAIGMTGQGHDIVFRDLSIRSQSN